MLGCISFKMIFCKRISEKSWCCILYSLYLNVIQSCWAFSVKPCCHSSYRPHIWLNPSRSLFVSSAREKSGASRWKQAQSPLEKVAGTRHYWHEKTNLRSVTISNKLFPSWSEVNTAETLGSYSSLLRTSSNSWNSCCLSLMVWRHWSRAAWSPVSSISSLGLSWSQWALNRSRSAL